MYVVKYLSKIYITSLSSDILYKIDSFLYHKAKLAVISFTAQDNHIVQFTKSINTK